VSVFRWTAALFKFAGRRWSEDDFVAIAERLRPYVLPGGVFADLGGGTGDLGKGVARALQARVVVIDPTSQMLRRVDAHPLVSVCLSSAERLPFPDGYFDGLLCSDAFHHLRDQGAAAAEMARVVRSGGGVLILDFEPTRANRNLARFERFLGEPAGFRTMADMQSFMASHGMVGHCASQRRGYLYLGTVKP
jgi:ubiquinone/menaquinone biosynthesis C-methylase UbiE